MAFSGGAGGGGNKPFSPFTITAGQIGQQPNATGSFTFGTGATGSSGFNFGGGMPAVTGTASAPQLSFTAATPAATTSSLFNFGGTTGAPTAPTVGLGTGVVAPVAAAPGYSFGTPSTAPVSAVTSLTSSFHTNQPLTFGAAPPVGTGIVQAASSAPISFTSVPPATATNTVQPTFGVPANTVAPAAINLTSGVSSASVITTATPTGLSFGAGTGALNLTNPVKPTTTTTAVGVTLPTSTSLGGSGVADASGASTSQLTTTTTTTQSNAAANVSQMNFRQLQEAINKWMLDLQEQEKIFLDQATKVNAWDRTLITNGDKIAKLNESITRVNNDHTRLEHALDYLKTQQQEFETFLEPLEAGLPMNIPVEPEREHLYSLTENVDTQLQQMAEDLKEVIRHINESNKTVDKSDPISQILRILNEHTDALQWVEDNANQVRRSLDDVSKHHQMAKKEHERSLRQMFK